MTSTDVTGARKDVTSTTAGDRQVALRSIFGACDRNGGYSATRPGASACPGTPAHPSPYPLACYHGRSRAEDRPTRVIAVLLAVHAMTCSATGFRSGTSDGHAPRTLTSCSAGRSRPTTASVPITEAHPHRLLQQLGGVHAPTARRPRPGRSPRDHRPVHMIATVRSCPPRPRYLRDRRPPRRVRQRPEVGGGMEGDRVPSVPAPSKVERRFRQARESAPDAPWGPPALSGPQLLPRHGR